MRAEAGYDDAAGVVLNGRFEVVPAVEKFLAIFESFRCLLADFLRFDIYLRVVWHDVRARRLAMVVRPPIRNFQLACSTAVEVPPLTLINACYDSLYLKLLKLLQQFFRVSVVDVIC